ncbi:MAG: extracellular solute-binding protein [Solirubrobacterales bacterium]|nr:extracellular solute-binding protein [Solirubrobacterales bacterium]
MTPHKRTLTRLATAITVAAMIAGLAGCGSTGNASSKGDVTITYALWDTNQAPVYEKCADLFHQLNPNTTVKLETSDWNDYWAGLARGFIADTAPDVFTDHLSEYPQFANSEVIDPLNQLAARDHVSAKRYLPGLAELWQTPNGNRYGFPKDWDTVAIVSNLGMLQKAGVAKQQLDQANWNPQTGGTFEQIAARLSVDDKGRRGDQPGFDPTHVAVYGLGLDPGGLTYGQTTWAGFARSTGFQFLNKNPWGTHYHYDDPRLAQTMAWWRHMIVKGYMPPLVQASTLGQTAMFLGGKVALAIDGDWQIGTYTSAKNIKAAFSPLPAGPQGSWSMFNGLADSIWVGSKHQAQDWQWVKFLAGPQCQNVVGASAVVFPAIAEATQRAVATHEKAGVDVSAFTSYVKARHTLLYPITLKAPQITLLVQPTMEKILLGDENARSALKTVNSQVNEVIKYR